MIEELITIEPDIFSKYDNKCQKVYQIIFHYVKIYKNDISNGFRAPRFYYFLNH